jgi:hypothetical protein
MTGLHILITIIRGHERRHIMLLTRSSAIQGMRRVYWYFLQYHRETGRMSLGTHYRLLVWLPIVSNTGSHAGDFETPVQLVEPALFPRVKG